MTNHIIVTKEGAPTRRKYVMRAINDHELSEAVTTKTAQQMWDYIQKWWPIGTKVQWIVRP